MPLAYASIPDMASLVSAADLAGFRGAPFPETTVQAAAETVRAECGWHIAPQIEQTIKVRTGGADSVNLPSLMVYDVLAVTDRFGTAVTGWDFWEHGVLDLPGGFPDVIKVTYIHGYRTCPKDLHGIIAERSGSQVSGRVLAESLAGRSVQLDGGYDPNTPAILNAYRLNPGGRE